MSKPKKRGAPLAKAPDYVAPTPEERANGSFLSCVECERDWPLRLAVPSLDRCVICAREWWRKEKAARIGHRWRMYGLSQTDIAEMLRSQNESCAICTKEISARTCHVDHNHDNGALRSLLCRRCNLALGHFEDSPELLRKAASYIESHRNNRAPTRPRAMRKVPKVPLRPRKIRHFIARTGEQIDLNDPKLTERLQKDTALQRDIDAYIAHKIAGTPARKRKDSDE